MRRAIRAAWWLLLAVGLIGAVRQAREAAAVRRGELATVGPTTAVVPPPDTGTLAGWVGGWAPQRPASGAGRAVASAWAAPATATGLVLALLSGGRVRFDRDHGCLVAEGAGGASARLLRLVGHGANTVGQVVISRYDPISPRLLAHEAGHVRQFERLGPLVVPLYLWWSARYGYRHNPLERSARLAARRCRGSADGGDPSRNGSPGWRGSEADPNPSGSADGGDPIRAGP